MVKIEWQGKNKHTMVELDMQMLGRMVMGWIKCLILIGLFIIAGRYGNTIM